MRGERGDLVAECLDRVDVCLLDLLGRPDRSVSTLPPVRRLQAGRPFRGFPHRERCVPYPLTSHV